MIALAGLFSGMGIGMGRGHYAALRNKLSGSSCIGRHISGLPLDL